MKLRLYNSLTRRAEDFVPLDPQRVTMYVCGPTVYNYVHIGNARPYVLFGLLARLLRRQYPKLIYARNITDVDDKINTAAAAAGVPITTITDRYAADFRADMAKLGADAPDVEPHATAHIPQIIAMCERLIAGGNAYAAEGHVLFDVASFPAYGELSRRSLDEMIAGARVEVAPYKKNPADFVLWKPSTSDPGSGPGQALPGWDSPWGRGRPGWHIECSAMSEAHLGETIDIHAGGNDLLFPHHENEVAQSTCAHGGKVFARYWLHNGMLSVEGRKMSKSLGNTLVLHELLQKHPPELLRYMLMKAHYHQPLDWSAAALEQAQRTLDGLYTTLRDLAAIPAHPTADLPEEFLASLADDLNTPEALAVLSRLAEAARKADGTQAQQETKSALLGAGAFLGLLQVDPEKWFQGGDIALATEALRTGFGFIDAKLKDLGGDELIQALLDERQLAKQRKDFAAADAIRTRLIEAGIQLEDTPQGPRWKRTVPPKDSGGEDRNERAN